MKKYVLGIALFGALLALCMLFGKKTLPDAELCAISLTQAGMAAPNGFALTLSEDGQSLLAELTICGEEVERQLEPALLREAEQILREYNIAAWDGFAKADPMVLDGESFSFSAHFADGCSITASGSNCFPKYYHEVCAALNALMEPDFEAGRSKLLD